MICVMYQVTVFMTIKNLAIGESVDSVWALTYQISPLPVFPFSASTYMYIYAWYTLSSITCTYMYVCTGVQSPVRITRASEGDCRESL